ncbi:MAG: HAMP domain-containing sensor histidine kinase, partial [bacterium]
MKPVYKKKPLNQYRVAEVISVVSHQLKTPLSVIKGYLEVLISEDLGQINQGQREYLKDALENTQRMIGLIKDLLDVSRIEENKLEIKNQLASLEDIVKEVICEFTPLIRAKNCVISFKVLGKIPNVNIDGLKIKQVVINIISNAIQYNERKGKIEVIIERKGNDVLFSCHNTGIGIG